MSKQELIDISHLITEEYYNVLVGRCTVVAQFEEGFNWISKKSENYIVAQFEGKLCWISKKIWKVYCRSIWGENNIGFQKNLKTILSLNLRGNYIGFRKNLKTILVAQFEGEFLLDFKKNLKPNWISKKLKIILDFKTNENIIGFQNKSEFYVGFQKNWKLYWHLKRWIWNFCQNPFSFTLFE